jgi:hypothetical protein
MMKLLEYLTIVILLTLSVAVIFLFFIYNGLDKRRFRVDRQMDKILPLLKKRVELVRDLTGKGILIGAPEIIPACDAFLHTKNLTKRLNALQVLADHHPAMERRLGFELTGTDAERYADLKELENMTRDFFAMYPTMADDYNERLEKPVFAFGAKIMRFKPMPNLDGLV